MRNVRIWGASPKEFASGLSKMVRNVYKQIIIDDHSVMIIMTSSYIDMRAMMKTFQSEQVPTPVRKAIQAALISRMEERDMSTYQLAAAMGSSQSTVYTAVEYCKFGGLFAAKALEWLKMDIDQVVKKYGDPLTAKSMVITGVAAAPSISPQVKTLGSKLKWSEVTISQVQMLFDATLQQCDVDTLKRAGNMYEAVNRDVLENFR